MKWNKIKIKKTKTSLIFMFINEYEWYDMIDYKMIIKKKEKTN